MREWLSSVGDARYRSGLVYWRLCMKFSMVNKLEGNLTLRWQQPTASLIVKHMEQKITCQIAWALTRVCKHVKFFRSSANIEAGNEASRPVVQKLHNECSYVFTGTGCFGGTSKLTVKEGSCPHQAQPRWMASTLQQPLKEKLDRLQKENIIVLLDVYETLEWCNSFVLVLKANEKVQLWLDPAKLNKVLNRPVHRRSDLNDLLPRLPGITYFTLIDTSSGYHYLKIDEQSSYWTTFSCLFGKYRYIRLPFWVVATNDMFQRKMMSYFMGYLMCLALLIISWLQEFNNLGGDHDETVDKVVKICRKANLKLNSDKCILNALAFPSLGKSYLETVWAQP